MMNLPDDLYKEMICMNDGDYYYGEDLSDLVDKYKYQNIDIFAHKWSEKNKYKYKLHHYRISYREIYRLSGIDGSDKIVCMCHQFQDMKLKEIVEHIRKAKQLKPMEYDLYIWHIGSQKVKNTISSSKRFLKNEIRNIYSRTGFKKEDIDIDITEIHYVCKDLNFEELDAIIYPNEYLDKTVR